MAAQLVSMQPQTGEFRPSMSTQVLILQYFSSEVPPSNPYRCLPPSTTQVLIVQFGGPAFQTVPLPADLWLACIGVGASTWLVRAALAATPGSNGKEASRAVAPSA